MEAKLPVNIIFTNDFPKLVSDLGNVILIKKKMWPLNKRHIRNSENVTNTAVFNNLGALAMTTATSRRTSKKQ